MIWFFKNGICYDYLLNQEISNDLTKRFYNSVYENSTEMELWFALEYMKKNNINKLSVVFPIDELSVQYGDQQDFDKTYCDENNILYRYERRQGGCLVLFPNNILTLDIRPVEEQQIVRNFEGDFALFLQNKGLEVDIDKNDILVDNKKIVGQVAFPLPSPCEGLLYFGTQISINSDSELIDKICTKPMNKVPGALIDYGITTSEVMNWMLDWFNKNQHVII